MSDIVDPKIEAYCLANTSVPPPYLDSLAAETRDTMDAPEMMVGPLEGKFLEMLVFTARASRILEIGTFTGYSALSMAAALPPGGHITTCEANPRHAEVARRHIAMSPYAGMIEVREGPALETLASLPGPFDLVFIDADKGSYVAYFDAALEKVSGRGIIVADNTLWGGKVLDPKEKDEDTRAIRAFNHHAVSDNRVTCVQLPIRDGVTLVRLR